jgi:hypothetical protein
MDRLGQFLRFLDTLHPGFVELGKLLLGDEIDRADPFALGCQAFEQCRLRVRIDDFAFVEAKLLG